MRLNIDLPSNIEHAVRERARAAWLDVETFITNVVQAKVSAKNTPPQAAPLTHAEFRSKLDETIQRHGFHNGQFDDSRESIYGGRGE